ncbi:hypothetical protein MKS78_14130 [Acinetobacter baumannii]
MTSATRTFKYGQKYKFSLLNEEKITIYLSHWPSKLNDVSLQIVSIAERLRVNIEDELNETKILFSLVIIMLSLTTQQLFINYKALEKKLLFRKNQMFL